MSQKLTEDETRNLLTGVMVAVKMGARTELEPLMYSIKFSGLWDRDFARLTARCEKESGVRYCAGGLIEVEGYRDVKMIAELLVKAVGHKVDYTIRLGA